MQRIMIASFVIFGLTVGSASAALHKYSSPGKSMHHHQRHGVAKYQKPSVPKYKKPH